MNWRMGEANTWAWREGPPVDLFIGDIYFLLASVDVVTQSVTPLSPIQPKYELIGYME